MRHCGSLLRLCGLSLLSVLGSAAADAQSFSFTLADGSVVQESVSSTGAITGSITGGAAGTTSFSLSILPSANDASLIRITGSLTASSVTTPIDCTVNTRTGAVAGTCGPNGFGLGLLTGQSAGTAATGATGTAALAAARQATAVQRRTVVSNFSDRAIYGFVNQTLSLRVADALFLRRLPSGAKPRVMANGVQAAGDEGSWLSGGTFYLWSTVNGSMLGDKRGGQDTDGQAASAMVGLEYQAGDFTFGLSTGYALVNLQLKSIGGHFRADGPVVSPYLAYAINEHLGTSLSFNYSQSGVALQQGADLLSSSSRYGTDRYGISGSLDGAWSFGEFWAYPSVGLTGNRSYNGAYTDSLGQAFGPSHSKDATATASGRLLYAGWDVTPYLSLAYVHQITNPGPNTDRGALIIGAGAQYAILDNLSIRFDAATQELKSHESNTTFGLNLRYAF